MSNKMNARGILETAIEMGYADDSPLFFPETGKNNKL
jgi:hypothetical protein